MPKANTQRLALICQIENNESVEKQIDAVARFERRIQKIVTFETFADIYQYAFGGCNEDFLKERYSDWLKTLQ